MHIDINSLKKRIVYSMAAVCLLVSCKTTRMDIVEPVKDISGNWQVIKVVQNGIDITAFADLTQFRIKFNSDNTYTLTGEVPFIVSKQGKWAFNDPQFPFSITFTPGGDANAMSSKLIFPIVNDKYQMGIEFNNKCDNKFENTYQYTLKQVTE